MRQWLIPATILILGLLSILTLSSIAPTLAPKQLTFFMIGFGLFFISSKTSFKRIQNWSVFLYIGTVLLLLLTLLIGSVTKGSMRWIDVGGVFSIQGSQLAILTSSLYLVTFFKNKPLTKLKNLFLFLLLTAIPGDRKSVV